MKVKELIRELNEFDPELEILMRNNFSDNRYLTDPEPKTVFKKVIITTFPPGKYPYEPYETIELELSTNKPILLSKHQRLSSAKEVVIIYPSGVDGRTFPELSRSKSNKDKDNIWPEYSPDFTIIT